MYSKKNIDNHNTNSKAHTIKLTEHGQAVVKARKNKFSCVYFCRDGWKCTRTKRGKLCYTAVDCQHFKRIQPPEPIHQKSRKLSQYHDNYTDMPEQASYHNIPTSSKRFGGIDVPVHVEYLKSDGHRRHWKRCRYLNHKTMKCSYYVTSCIGSGNCVVYKE